MFEVPLANTELRETAFSFCAAHTWDTLPQTVKRNALVPICHFKTMITKVQNSLI